MSKLSIAVVSVMWLGVSARADTFGGWHYTAPPGYTVTVEADHVAFTRVNGSTFCSIAVFEARPLGGELLAERAFEWKNVVTHQFTATVKRRATLRTKLGADVAATSATLVGRDGEAYSGVHYVVMPPGMIGSVLLTSTTPAAVKACEPAATSVVRSLAIDWSSPRFNDPEARAQTPEGRWAVVGPTSREYTFSTDGSYRFHSESPGAERDRIVDETGKYTFQGNQLTLTAIKATAAVVERGAAKAAIRLPLESTTYTWGKLYDVAANAWELVLTPRKATARDGKLPAKGSTYRYSDQAKPVWKYAPQPGA